MRSILIEIVTENIVNYALPRRDKTILFLGLETHLILL